VKFVISATPLPDKSSDLHRSVKNTRASAEVAECETGTRDANPRKAKRANDRFT